MKEVVAFIKRYKKFGVFTHANPDGDALGSAYALAQGINNLGGHAEVVLLCEPPWKYDFGVFRHLFVLKDKAAFGSYNAHIAVDCAAIGRLGSAVKEIFRSRPSASIDHHISNTNFAEVNWVHEAAATGEMVYNLLGEMGAQKDDVINIATYIAIATDTGNFTYSNTTESTLKVFCALVSGGLDLPTVANQVFNTRTLGATKLIGRFIENMRMHHDGRLALSTIMLDEIKQAGANVDDCENLIDYARNVDSAEVAVLIREMKANVYKISLRSKDYVDVSELASRFDGGGHFHASGYRAEGNIFDILQNVIKVVGEYLDNH